MSRPHSWGRWGTTDAGRRARRLALDTAGHGVHSALVPPGALHQRVTAALANWQLDDAEALLADTERDPSPYVAPEPSRGPAAAGVSLGRAWADTLRAELLVRRLRMAGFTLVGEPVRGPEEPAEPALDLHAGVVGLIEGAPDEGTRAEDASRAAEAIALVRSAKAAFEATDDGLQRAAGLARHARIELLSRRIDAAMDEAVEAASLLDPGLPPGRLLVDTLTTLAGVLADLELMPLALDYQRRAHEAAAAAAAEPAVLGPDDGTPDVLVATAATRLGELCAELGEGLLEDGAVDVAGPAVRRGPRAGRAGAAAAPPGRRRPGRRPGGARLGAGRARRGRRGHRPAARRRPPVQRDRRPGAAGLGAAGAGPGAAPPGRFPRRRRPPRADPRAGHRARPAPAAPGRAARAVHAALRARRRRPGAALPAGLHRRRAGPRRRAAHPLGGAVRPPQEPAGDRAGRRASCAARPTRTPSPRCPTAATPRRGWTACSPPGRRPRWPWSTSTGSSRSTTPSATPAGTSSCGGSASCWWPASATATRCAAGPATSSSSCCRRPPPSRPSGRWSASGSPSPARTGPPSGLTTPVTISVGIASAARGDDRRTLFAAADGVLYDAKRSGRDRVVRLSAVTQTRADDAGPLDARLEAPAPAPAPGPPPPTTSASPSPRSWPSRRRRRPPAAPRGPRGRVPRPDPRGRRPGRGAGRRLGARPQHRAGAGRRPRGLAEQPDRTVVVLRAAAETLAALAAEHGGAATVDPDARAAAVGPRARPAAG